MKHFNLDWTVFLNIPHFFKVLNSKTVRYHDTCVGNIAGGRKIAN